MTRELTCIPVHAEDQVGGLWSFNVTEHLSLWHGTKVTAAVSNDIHRAKVDLQRVELLREALRW